MANSRPGLIAALATLWLFAACASGPTREDERAAPPTPLPGQDFAAYVGASRTHVERYGAPTGPLPADLVRDRAPFELGPGSGCPEAADRGALLIHDLGGTPFEMRDLAERLGAACFKVRAILLPGHGTAPSDLDGVTGEVWRTAVNRGRASFAGEVEALVMAGFGLGATLALLDAGEPNEPPVDALVLIAPRLAAPGFDLGLASLFVTNGRVGHGAPGLPNPVRYRSLPTGAKAVAWELADSATRDGLVQDRPVFVVGSADDGTADPEAAWAWFCEQPAGPRRLLWYAKGNALPGECAFVAARASDGFTDVLGFSHVGLPVAPGNPRLGVDAPSPFACDHYGSEQSRKWLLCADPAASASDGVRYGAPADARSADGIVRTLGWNPDFDQMADDIVAFLGRPGSP